MLNLRTIYKPRTVEEAVRLLKQPGTVVLAGGTDLIASGRRDVEAAVDLSGLDLAYIRTRDDVVTIGAMTLLAALADSPVLQNGANGIVTQAVRRTKTNILRNQATLAGTLIAEPAGILATALAALEARVIMVPPSELDVHGTGIALVEFLAGRAQLLPGAIVTDLRIPGAALQRSASIETVARTPQDAPIVSIAASLQVENGAVQAAAIALGGVSESVLRAVEAEKELAGSRLTGDLISRVGDKIAARLNPPADFRASGEYRREMVKVLTIRVLQGFLSKK